jgi:hypothetical protein
LIALFCATTANFLALTNAISIRDNCRRIDAQNRKTRNVFEEQLKLLDSGQLDDDYQRIYGPDADEKKEAQRANLVVQIDRFGEIDCTITIVRWIKGD